MPLISGWHNQTFFIRMPANNTGDLVKGGGWKKSLGLVLLGMVLMVILELAALFFLNGARINSPVSFIKSEIANMTTHVSTVNSTAGLISVKNLYVNGVINVTGVNASGNGKISGTLNYHATHPGFTVPAGTNISDVLTIPDSFQYGLTISRIVSSSPNVTLEGAYPQVPIAIAPYGAENITLFFKTSSQNFTGNVSVYFYGSMTK